jgi:hypothetical protein
MRNIDIPGAKEIFARQDELMATFWQNRGYIKAAMAIHEAVRDEYFFEKMQNLRYANNRKNKKSYEEQAREYYNKYGTSGEF